MNESIFRSYGGRQTIRILKQVHSDLQEVEQQQQSEADLALEKVEELQSALDDEKRKKEACEQQIQQQLQVCEVPSRMYGRSLVWLRVLS